MICDRALQAWSCIFTKNDIHLRFLLVKFTKVLKPLLSGTIAPGRFMCICTTYVFRKKEKFSTMVFAFVVH